MAVADPGRTVSIQWGGMTIAEWDRHFATIERSNLLQHYPYAQAIRSTRYLGARHGLILWEGAPAGLVQVQDARTLYGMINAVQLDRGPLWFPGHGCTEQISKFFHHFNSIYPRRIGRRRRIIPELQCQQSPAADTINLPGLIRNDRVPGYETIWIDLSQNLDEMRSKMSANWRNALARAERSDVAVELDERGASASEFLGGYQRSKSEKGYSGPSESLLKALIYFMLPRREVLIFSARRSSSVLASILVLVHGRSATYQASWTTEDGRRFSCHNRLIWEAMRALKTRGIYAFDLGGVHHSFAPGVTKFKSGLGGQAVKLCGQYS